MALESGSIVGPYEIVSPLGAGGMGEVYRARDTRLNRDIALKVLPASMAQDEERLRRFTLEAQAAGGLNHPNILTIFDIGTAPVSQAADRSEAGGIPVTYLAAELLEGETLRAKLDAGALPLSKATTWARQTAEGLAAAHAKGITHRDIKPENLFITRDGRLKILDFGLAKNAAAEPAATADDATRLDQVTSAGVVLGTAGYMSPEQVRAQPVDPRSDIFSLGVVLYEMLSGRRPFVGDSMVETMNAILTMDPPELTPASSSDRALPAAVGHVVSHCLEKNPEERFQSARDLAFALEALSGSSSASSGSAPGLGAVAREAAAGRDATAGRSPSRSLSGLVALTATVAAVVFAALLFTRPAPGASLGEYRFRAVATDPEIEMLPAWSPDGRTIAYVKEVDDIGQIFLREIGVEDALQLTRGDTSATSPFWWPDSNRVGFLHSGRVMSVTRAGGEPTEVIGVAESIGSVQAAALSPDGSLLAAWASEEATNLTTLYFAAIPGGTLERVESGPFEQLCCTTPTYLTFAPDGRSLLLSHFALYRGNGRAAVWRVPVPAGSGDPVEVFADTELVSLPAFSWMPDSRHLVAGFKASDAPAPDLWLADVEAGSFEPISVGLGGHNEPSVSPDGTQIAFVSGGPDHDLVEIPLDGTSPVRSLLSTSRNEYGASWMVDTPRFAYVTDRNGPDQLRLRNADGTEGTVANRSDFGLALSDGVIGAPVISPDGRRVAYHVFGTGSGSAVWISPTGGGTPTRAFEEDELQTSPIWSPDGRSLAMWRLNKGLSIMQIGDSAPPRVIAADAASSPLHAWSPDGRWIAFRAQAGLVVVSPDGETTREISPTADVGIAWSPDSRTIYTVDGPARSLIAVDVVTGRSRVVRPLGDDMTFGVPSSPGQRFSVRPDGSALTATVVRVRTDIWTLEGFPQPGGFFSRWFGR